MTSFPPTNKPFTISILIPAHNEEAMIRSCISSCLAQSRKADQILVVDDGSTDKTYPSSRLADDIERQNWQLVTFLDLENDSTMRSWDSYRPYSYSVLQSAYVT